MLNITLPLKYSVVNYFAVLVILPMKKVTSVHKNGTLKFNTFPMARTQPPITKMIPKITIIIPKMIPKIDNISMSLLF